MPKTEEQGPWATTKACLREPYPRKNVYFVGDHMDEVYDYCIWRANITGHKKLDGSPARGSLDMITDLLTREYLRAMLDERESNDFLKWRRSEYVKAGLDRQDADPRLLRRGRPPNETNTLETALVKLQGRSRQRTAAALRIWQTQDGKCAVCNQKRILQFQQNTGKRPANDKATKAVGGFADNTLVCTSCNSKAGGKNDRDEASFRR